MTLTDSIVRLTWAPGTGNARVLVDFGDPMWEEVSIDGGQDVEELARYRATGIVAAPRGNERHQLRFVLARETADPAAALKAAMDAAVGWPRGRADVLIEIGDAASNTDYLLKNAACRSWGGGPGEEHVSREGLEITGGEITAS